MWICDTHSDTLYAMGVTKTPEAELMITPERLRQGGVTLQTFALWSGRQGNQGDVQGVMDAEMSVVPRMLAAGLKQVDDPSEAKEGEHAFMLSIEGAEIFEQGLAKVAEWREKGVRMVALMWNNENKLGHSAKSGSREGLTAYGIQVAKELQRLHMAVDTSHLNEVGFYDLFAKTDVAPMASHSCCRALCDHCRNLSDEQLRLLIREGGYVGVNFYPYFLHADGKATLQTVVEHIDHICQLGGEKIVGFGSDFDGIECWPENLATPADIPALLDALRRRGYDETTVADIAGQNFLRYFAKL